MKGIDVEELSVQAEPEGKDDVGQQQQAEVSIETSDPELHAFLPAAELAALPLAAAVHPRASDIGSRRDRAYLGMPPSRSPCGAPLKAGDATDAKIPI